jgi:simple sugar transport system ATP-binding protein
MLNPRERREIGLAFAPEERLGHAAVGNLNLLENSLITDPKKRFQKKMGFIDFSELNKYTNEIIEKFNVKTTGVSALASSLSGGNLQKFVVGREIEQKPSLFIVNQPTWGVDALSAANIRQAIVEIANNGAAIILISQDLDEILEISNKVAFLTNGNLSIPTNTMDIKTDEIGAIMGGIGD